MKNIKMLRNYLSMFKGSTQQVADGLATQLTRDGFAEYIPDDAPQVVKAGPVQNKSISARASKAEAAT
jgi:hypothetical protein